MLDMEEEVDMLPLPLERETGVQELACPSVNATTTPLALPDS